MRVLKMLSMIAVLFLFCTGAALAQTPDGETPAEETVCDGLTGAQFGLCNAYCEAMDCDSDSPNASAEACEKVLDNFRVKSGGADPPCVEPSNCCEAHNFPGCDDPTCENLICSFDPFCCNVVWDFICADAANDLCAVCQ